MASSSSPSRGSDRLSNLPDAVAGHILSFLPNKEAGRAAALSRWWRDIFCNVHTVSFEEREGERADDWDTFYYEAEERKSCSYVLLDDVCSALLCRRRCAGIHVPLRSFHFAFDRYHRWDRVHVDQWLAYVLRHSRQELHLDLRFRIGPICYIGGRNYDGDGKKEEAESGSDEDDDWRYLLPRKLFSCTALRTLCVSYCQLKLPEAINLPFLETLRLTGLNDSGGSIQRLISSCPRLADLTLEALCKLKSVSVLDKCLRRFALRCCHGVKNVSIDASELRSLDYTGTVPAESLLSLHGGSPVISSCTIDFCKVRSKEAELVVRFRKFLEKVSGSKHLHLHYRSLESRFFAVLPSFSSLRRLVLQGPLHSCVTVDAVRRILVQTPNLEVLSLYVDMPKPKSGRRYRLYGDDDDDDQGCDQSEVPDGFVIPDESSFSIPCLRHQVREINMVHYQGDEPQRMMAELLLRNALVLERLCVVLSKGPFALQAELKEEIESWLVVANPEKIFL